MMLRTHTGLGGLGTTGPEIISAIEALNAGPREIVSARITDWREIGVDCGDQSMRELYPEECGPLGYRPAWLPGSVSGFERWFAKNRNGVAIAGAALFFLVLVRRRR